MTNPLLLPSSPILLAALLIQAHGTLGWNPRLSLSSRGGRGGLRINSNENAGSSGGGNRQRVVLSASNSNDAASNSNGEKIDDDESIDTPRRGPHHHRRENHDDVIVDHQPALYAEGNEIHEYMITRLESIFDMDSPDFFTDMMDEDVNGEEEEESEESESESSPRRLLDGGERVVLGDWMEWEEGKPCYGESCGDDFDEQCDIPKEFKVAEPKVDVMAFLGIRRAAPLKKEVAEVQRDWD